MPSFVRARPSLFRSSRLYSRRRPAFERPELSEQTQHQYSRHSQNGGPNLLAFILPPKKWHLIVSQAHIIIFRPLPFYIVTRVTSEPRNTRLNGVSAARLKCRKAAGQDDLFRSHRRSPPRLMPDRLAPASLPCSKASKPPKSPADNIEIFFDSVASHRFDDHAAAVSGK